MKTSSTFIYHRYLMERNRKVTATEVAGALADPLRFQILGQLLEPAIGSVRFAALYFVSLLGGAFGALLVSPHSLTVGASGAVFGLMGGAVVAMRARGFDPMQSGIPGLIAINLLFSFLFPGISVGGHIGGLVAGAAAAFILVELGERRRSAILPLLGCAALGAAAVAGSLAVAGGSGL